MHPEGVTITKEGTSGMEVAFSNGVTARVSHFEGSLSFSLALPQLLKGIETTFFHNRKVNF